MPLAAVTRLRVRRLRFLPQFLISAYRSRAEARRTEGYLAADMRTTGARVFWTRTLWRDTAAMRRFMAGGGAGGLAAGYLAVMGRGRGPAARRRAPVARESFAGAEPRRDAAAELATPQPRLIAAAPARDTGATPIEGSHP